MFKLAQVERKEREERRRGGEEERKVEAEVGACAGDRRGVAARGGQLEEVVVTVE